MLAKKLESAAKAVEAAYVEDVFSTYLYTGNGSTQTINNGIDLSGKGGLVWLKDRSGASINQHTWVDTNRGVNNWINSASTFEQSPSNILSSYNTTGFTLSDSVRSNQSGASYVGWTFRKQPKFFDVVTYTGTGSSRTVAHNLGSTPGCIIIKRTSGVENWTVYHRSQGANKVGFLNLTNAFGTNNTIFGNTSPTSTVFTLGDADAGTNANGSTYVAYLFAHDAGGFGLTGTDNVISCGMYTGGAGGIADVNLGYEPQLVITKIAVGTDPSSANDWYMIDNMRGFTVNASTGNATLSANTSTAEVNPSSVKYLTLNATGFKDTNCSSSSADKYIYIAIRRGPMKVPTDATKVFQPATRTGTGTTATVTSTISPIDMLFSTNTDRVASSVNSFWDRLRGGGFYLNSNSTNAEASSTSVSGFDVQNGVKMQGALITNGNSYPYVNYNFRRAPGYMDVCCYTGTGSATTFSHNLTVVPELMIFKVRGSTGSWQVYAAPLGATNALILESTNASAATSNFNNTAPTSSVFSVGSFSGTNGSGLTYVNYLFASAPGVSKVGSYTGNGSNQTINCGFTGGARFVLIKRTDSTGDWYVWDTARGIVSGNDPRLSLNTTAAEVTTDDSVDTDSTGFVVNQLSATNINVTSATYIFLAIA